MTVLVGLVDNGAVWLGVDGRGSATCGAYPVADEDPKLFRRGEMLLAYAGEKRVGQILRHVLEIPEHAEGLSTMAYLVTCFVPALRAELADGGWRVEYDEKSPSWTVLLGYRGGLYEVYSSFQIDVAGRPYTAAGCAEMVAQGSLYSTNAGTPYPVHLTPRERITMALEAAAEHDIHVSPPFTILALEA